MANRPLSSTTPGPEHERRSSRRLWVPFAVAAGVIVLVLAVVFGVTRPWEGSDTAQRDVPPQEVPARPR